MTITPIYFGTGQPGGALPEKGPGSPASPSAPLGFGVVVGTSTYATATVEVRANLLTTAGNASTAEAAATASTADVIKSLYRIIYFLKQRGYIVGSGGPTTPGN